MFERKSNLPGVVFPLSVTKTEMSCPTGEIIGERNMSERIIPVLSCEGGCIRGEIARLAANKVAKETGYSRGCHGELLTVPDSAISRWIRTATHRQTYDFLILPQKAFHPSLKRVKCKLSNRLCLFKEV